MTDGRNKGSADFCRVLADSYRDGWNGDCSREWFDMVESLRDNLCYYEEA